MKFGILPPYRTGVTADPDWMAAVRPPRRGARVRVGLRGRARRSCRPATTRTTRTRRAGACRCRSTAPSRTRSSCWRTWPASPSGSCSAPASWCCPAHEPAHAGQAARHHRRAVRRAGCASASASAGSARSSRRSASTSATRGARTDEAIEALQALWTEDEATLRRRRSSRSTRRQPAPAGAARRHPDPRRRPLAAAARRAGRLGDGFQPLGLEGDELARAGRRDAGRRGRRRPRSRRHRAVARRPARPLRRRGARRGRGGGRAPAGAVDPQRRPRRDARGDVGVRRSRPGPERARPTGPTCYVSRTRSSFGSASPGRRRSRTTCPPSRPEHPWRRSSRPARWPTASSCRSSRRARSTPRRGRPTPASPSWPPSPGPCDAAGFLYVAVCDHVAIPRAVRREDEHVVVGHDDDARLPGRHHRAGAADEPRRTCCRTATRCMTAKAFLTLDEVSRRPGDPRRRRRPRRGRVRAARRRLRRPGRACSTRASTWCGPRSPTSTRGTTARGTRSPTPACGPGPSRPAARRSGSAARRRRRCAGPRTAATAGCRRARRRTACGPGIELILRAPRARPGRASRSTSASTPSRSTSASPTVRRRAVDADRVARPRRRAAAPLPQARRQPHAAAVPVALGRRAARPDRAVRRRGRAAARRLTDSARDPTASRAPTTGEQNMGMLDGKVAVVSGLGPGMGRDISLALAGEGADIVMAARQREAHGQVSPPRSRRSAAGRCRVRVRHHRPPTTAPRWPSAVARRVRRRRHPREQRLPRRRPQAVRGLRPRRAGARRSTSTSSARMQLTRALLPLLTEQDDSRVIMINTMSTQRIERAMGAYAASKARAGQRHQDAGRRARPRRRPGQRRPPRLHLGRLGRVVLQPAWPRSGASRSRRCTTRSPADLPRLPAVVGGDRRRGRVLRLAAEQADHRPVPRASTPGTSSHERPRPVRRRPVGAGRRQPRLRVGRGHRRRRRPRIEALFGDATFVLGDNPPRRRRRGVPRPSSSRG